MTSTETDPSASAASRPLLFIESRTMTAVQLSEESAGGPGTMWFITEDDDPWQEIQLCREGLTYKTLAETPSLRSLTIARQLEEILDGVMLPASESDTKGRAFVITSPNGSTMDPTNHNQVCNICLDALGIVDEARSSATFRERDWTEAQQQNGFCYAEDEFEEEDLDDDDPQSDRSKVMRATQVMIDELQNGFELNFDNRVICGPVLYGGFVGQDIVGILSMRVWT
mmetsp:Transcript_17073/g.24037  ORF Transcript_17073/g.24037 Transcript_17073/m.24037 type:complete len:227 (-) Transcript_17073:3344-4024(-)